MGGGGYHTKYPQYTNETLKFISEKVGTPTYTIWVLLKGIFSNHLCKWNYKILLS